MIDDRAVLTFEFDGSCRGVGGCPQGRLECGFTMAQTSLDNLRPSDQNATDERSVGRDLYSARPKLTHLNVATFRQNVGLLNVPPALWRGAATSQFGPREV